MKVKISNDKFIVLMGLKNHMLMDRTNLLVIKDFTYITEKHTPKKTIFNRYPVEQEIIYIVDATVLCYHTKENWLGMLSDIDAMDFLTNYPISDYRRQWYDFKDQLTAFGIELKILNKTKQEHDTNIIL